MSRIDRSWIGAKTGKMTSSGGDSQTDDRLNDSHEHDDDDVSGTDEEDPDKKEEPPAAAAEANDDGIKSKPSPPTYIGLVIFCLFALGVYDVVVSSTASTNPCQMTYMYELPHYINLNLTTNKSGKGKKWLWTFKFVLFKDHRLVYSLPTDRLCRRREGCGNVQQENSSKGRDTSPLHSRQLGICQTGTRSTH